MPKKMNRLFILFSIALVLPALSASSTAFAQERFIPGDIYVSEQCYQFPPSHGDRIWRVDPETGEATIFYQFQLTTNCSGQYIQGLAFTPDGMKLRAARIGAIAIYEFDAQANMTVVLDASDGIGGPGVNQSLTYDRQGNFYVGDWWTSRVLMFPADGGPAQTLLGPADGFFGPEGLAIAANGDLYAIDQTFPGKVFRRTPEGVVSLFDEYPTGNEDPVAIAADRDGYVYVHLDDTGRLLRYVQGHPETEEQISDSGFGGIEDESMTLSGNGSMLYIVVRHNIYMVTLADESMGLFTVLPHTEFNQPDTRGVAIVPFALGDLNYDASVNLSDYQILEGCLHGPLVESGGTACWAADLDTDGNVDLRDFAEFERILTNTGE